MTYIADLDQISAAIAICNDIRLSDSRTVFESEEVLPLLIIDTPLCRAVISIQGAQLLEFVRKSDNSPLLWCSPNAIFQKNKAVRGGIPVCFPWFGAHATDTSKPNHGFVRENDWHLEKASNLDDGAALLRFSFNSCTETLNLFPHAFKTTLEFTLGNSIGIQLSVKNLSDAEMPCSWALHSYLPVSHVDEVEIHGLDGNEYLDTVGVPTVRKQTGAVTFSGEVDRVYRDVGEAQIIQCQKSLRISGHDCPTAIVWNPGAELASGMADLGEMASKGFVCLERGAAFDNAWSIAPGEEISAEVFIAAQS